MAKTYNPIRNTFEHGGVSEPDAIETEKYSAPIAFPADRATKTIACSKCGRGISVGSRVVLAYCAACSEGMGVKR